MDNYVINEQELL